MARCLNWQGAPCAQVCIPVHIPGRPPQSVALVGLQRSDARLLAAAEKLGPLVSEAAAKLAAASAATANGAAAGPGSAAGQQQEQPLPNGTAKRARAGEGAVLAALSSPSCHRVIPGQCTLRYMGRMKVALRHLAANTTSLRTSQCILKR